MKQITFPLKLRMKGSKVSNLQTALQLFLDREVIPERDDDDDRRKVSDKLERELTKQYYGRTTQELVKRFQKVHQLGATGTVDKVTATTMNRLLGEQDKDEENGRGKDDNDKPYRFYIVSGKVQREDGLLLQGIRVRAVHEAKKTPFVWVRTQRMRKVAIPFATKYYQRPKASACKFPPSVRTVSYCKSPT